MIVRYIRTAFGNVTKVSFGFSYLSCYGEMESVTIVALSPLELCKFEAFDYMVFTAHLSSHEVSSFCS